MTVHVETAGHGHDHSHGSHAHDDHGHGEGGGAHSTYRGYITGFVLSVILTAIPFWLVMGHVLSTPTATAFAVMILAVVQIIVHMVYFLHMNSKSEGGWTLLSTIFTIVLVVIALSGSLWVMYHLQTNMMPMSIEDMRNAP